MKAGVSSAIRRQTLSFIACFASAESVDKEVTIISVRGVPDGVTYSIAGRLNYEFIPGAELKSDLTRQENTSCETDLLAALRVQEYLKDTVAVSRVMTVEEY